MTAIAVVAAALAAAILGRTRRTNGRRLDEVVRPPGSAEAAPLVSAQDDRRSVGRLVLGAVVVIAGVVAIGGGFGVVLGLAGGAAVLILRTGDQRPCVNPDEVPIVVDLVSGCLAAGAALSDALDAASIAGDDVMRAACQSVAASLRSGTPPEEAWRDWLADPWLAPVARTAVRTSQSGAAAAADLRRTSIRLRARRRAAAQHKVRQASVWLVAPLGLCFLPAFVLVAVVPLVIGLVPSLR